MPGNGAGEGRALEACGTGERRVTEVRIGQSAVLEADVVETGVAEVEPGVRPVSVLMFEVEMALEDPLSDAPHLALGFGTLSLSRKPAGKPSDSPEGTGLASRLKNRIGPASATEGGTIGVEQRRER